MYKFRFSIQALIIAYLCSALVACGGGSSSASTTAVTAYTITTTASTGGSVTPGTTTVNSGQTAKFTVSASNGYTVQSVTGCGGTLSGNTYITGPVTANCTVNASFKPITYTVTANAGSGGTITPPSMIVKPGKTAAFNVIASSGYVIQSVTGCAGELSGSTYTTGVITANCSVTANFSPEWTWESGSDLGNQVGIYGTQGVATTTNTPGARDSAMTWVDSSGNLWLFGGNGIDSKKTWGDMNDLWMYSPVTKEWTWESGSDLANQPPVYGTEGVANASNSPGARESAVTWTDSNGNLWMFGGYGNGANGTSGGLNDLWKYSTVTHEWTWESGSNMATSSKTGVYGVQGVASATNVPGARAGAVSWTDLNGNFWLFGGSWISGGVYNDLWMYSPTTHEWTWEGGPDVVSQTGVYGTQGVATASNIPGARAYAISWTDLNGNFWMFGGIGIDSKGTYGNCLNDLWMYSPTTHEWTWEGGSNVAGQTGVYGSQGVASASNIPGARAGAVSWADSSGNFWMFGGINGLWFNDLWMYSPTAHDWTWEGGLSTATDTQPGIYGMQGITALTNQPGAREGAVAWTDISGTLWLFGGSGLDSKGTFGTDLNDLWMYPKP